PAEGPLQTWLRPLRCRGKGKGAIPVDVGVAGAAQTGQQLGPPAQAHDQVCGKLRVISATSTQLVQQGDATVQVRQAVAVSGNLGEQQAAVQVDASQTLSVQRHLRGGLNQFALEVIRLLTWLQRFPRLLQRLQKRGPVVVRVGQGVLILEYLRVDLYELPQEVAGLPVRPKRRLVLAQAGQQHATVVEREGQG